VKVHIIRCWLRALQRSVDAVIGEIFVIPDQTESELNRGAFFGPYSVLCLPSFTSLARAPDSRSSRAAKIKVTSMQGAIAYHCPLFCGGAQQELQHPLVAATHAGLHQVELRLGGVVVVLTHCPGLLGAALSAPAQHEVCSKPFPSDKYE
jgi:hypothetical protein